MRSLVKILVALVVVLVPVRARAQESTTVAAERVSVRATPSNDGKLVLTLARGTSVKVLERREPWVKVSARSKSGWVRSNSLRAVARKSSPAAAPAPAQQRTAPVRAATHRPAAAPVGALRTGDNVLGPVVGLGGMNGSLAVGAELEHALATLPTLGNGTLGLSVQAFYYRWAPFPGTTINTIPFGAAANYHFVLRDRRIDPFLGLGLGYAYTSASVLGYSGSFNSGVFLWGRAGVRYFVKPGLALHADAGLGSSSLNVGVMFRP